MLSLAELKDQVQKIRDINDTPTFKACVKASYDWLNQEFDNDVVVDELVHGRATFVDALVCHAWHLLGLDSEKGLRSHGGAHEATVPMLFNRPLKPDYAQRLASGQARNFDLFDFLCNGTVL